MSKKPDLRLPKKAKRAKALGLEKAVYAALLWTRKQLKNEAILDNGVRHGNSFDMCIVARGTTDNEGHICGTRACIGGWMAIHYLDFKQNKAGVYALPYYKRVRVSKMFRDWCSMYPALNDLFNTFSCGVDYEDPLVAARVIDHYLVTGEVDWATTEMHKPAKRVVGR